MRPHRSLQAVNKQCSVQERDFPEPGTYVAYVLQKLYVIHKLTVFSAMKNQNKIHLMNQVLNVLSDKQVAPLIYHQGLCPSVIKAYADQ